jgi:hypothetical protein
MSLSEHLALSHLLFGSGMGGEEECDGRILHQV